MYKKKMFTFKNDIKSFVKYMTNSTNKQTCLMALNPGKAE